MSLWKSVRSPSPATNETNPDSVPSNEDEGFNSEPFVRAAVLYRESRFSDILEVLTEAVESGTHTVGGLGGAEWVGWAGTHTVGGLGRYTHSGWVGQVHTQWVGWAGQSGILLIIIQVYFCNHLGNIISLLWINLL